MINLYCIRPIGFNIGNDAIFLGVMNRITEAFGQVVNLINIPATARYASHGRAGLTAKTVHEINQYGHGVIIGGGNLFENGELDLNPEALTKLEAPLMLFSLSRGRIYNRCDQLVDRTDVMADSLIRALSNATSLLLARDNVTLKYLHKLGCGQAELGGCPTIFSDSIAHRLPEANRSNERDVFLSIRHPSLMNISPQRQMSVYTQVGQIIELLRKADLGPVRLLCHDHRDIPFAASFNGIDYVYTGDAWSYLAMLKNCALNVSFRVHAALPCMAFGAPFINITYDERGQSLLDTVGFSGWNINLLEHDDLTAAVADRLTRLHTLAGQRLTAQPVWNRLELVQSSAFTRFAERVHAYAATLRR